MADISQEATILTGHCSEIFGASEDESAFDNSAGDTDTGRSRELYENLSRVILTLFTAKEIEELRRESEALKKIRQSVGTEDFAQMLFDKVFNSDIIRLRSVEDMWKTRKAPEPLDYKTVIGQASEAIASTESILSDGQRVWSLEENMAVFVDSLHRLSKRMLEMKKVQESSGAEPLIEFDKDDDDTLDFVAASANIRSAVFGIDRRSRFDIKQMAGNIIPAIATTNAIVAGLCVLEAFKVLRGEYNQTKEVCKLILTLHFSTCSSRVQVFLTPFAAGRLLGSDRPREPNPNCPVCSVFQTGVYVDMERATLNDLVEDFLRLDLGYGEKEIAVSTESGNIIYDVEETENLSKKLSDLGRLFSY